MASGLFLWVIFTLIGSFMSGRDEYKVRVPMASALFLWAIFNLVSSFMSGRDEYIQYKVSIHHGVRCVPVGHLHLHCEYDVSTRYSWRQVCSNRPSSIHAWRREVGTIKYKTGKSTIAAVSSLQKCFCHQRKLFLC